MLAMRPPVVELWLLLVLDQHLHPPSAAWAKSRTAASIDVTERRSAIATLVA